jgi:hypothetical protein
LRTGLNLILSIGVHSPRPFAGASSLDLGRLVRPFLFSPALAAGARAAQARRAFLIKTSGPRLR